MRLKALPPTAPPPRHPARYEAVVELRRPAGEPVISPMPAHSPQLAVAALFLTLAAAGCAREVPAVVLAHVATPYVEDEPEGRQLAEMELTLERTNAQAELRIELGAQGLHVAPVAGLAGERGTNRITARELGRLSLDGDLEIRSVARDGRVGPRGSLRALRKGHLPETRVQPDGSVELAVPSHEEFTLELELRSGPLGPGEWTTELWVAGRPRLRIRHRFDGEAGSIDEVDCRPGPAPDLELQQEKLRP